MFPRPNWPFSFLPVKNTGLQLKLTFLLINQNMLLVLKRTISMRRLFCTPYNQLLWWQVTNNVTDTGFYIPWRIGYNFGLAKLLEKPSGTLWWTSTLVSVKRPYRNKLTLHLSQTKPQLTIISEVSREVTKNGYLFRLCVSPSKSAIWTYILIWNRHT